MDRRTIILWCVSLLSLALCASSLLPWISGRSNGMIPLSLLGVFCALSGLIAAIWLLARLCAKTTEGGVFRQVSRFAVFLLVFSPLLVLPSNTPGCFQAYGNGFERWTNCCVKEKAVREWYASSPALVTEEDAPRRWRWPVATELESLMCAAPERDSWPEEVAEMSPRVVRVIPDQGVLFFWEESIVLGGFPRFVFVGSSDAAKSPEFFLDWAITWRSAGDGVYAAVFNHP